MNLRVWAAATLAALLAFAAGAQEPETPDVPAGDATIRGRLVSKDAKVGGALVILYSLTTEGEPGLRRGNADADGNFVFEKVSRDPSLVYLVGARVGGVPFGARAQFPPDQREVAVEIPVSLPSEDASRLARADVRLRFGIGCTHLRVQQTHVLRNDSDRVLYVPPEHRESARPLLEAALPAGAEGFELMLAAGAESVDRKDDRLRFWGPLHPGRHEVEWAYGLPLADQVAVNLPVPDGASELRVLTPVGPLRAHAKGLRADGERTLPDGRYAVQSAGKIAPGGSIALAIDVPSNAAPERRPKVEEARLWLELDDVALDVSEEHIVKVDGDEPVDSGGGVPLLCLPLPADAHDLRFATSTLEFGPTRDPSGALAIHGPLPAGQSSLALRYRLASNPGVMRFTRTFGNEVPLLQVLVADTGVMADGPRLHRKRPIVTEDRIYLPLESFGVAPQEEILVTLDPLPARSGGASGLASGVVLLGALGALVFLAAPLRRGDGEALPERESASAFERESIYRAIDALDEDLETGKVSGEDHAQMRAALRARAVALLAREREQAASAGAAPASAFVPDAAPCRGCGAKLRAADRFCSQCGAPRGDLPA
jgi:hypothetical protein